MKVCSFVISVTLLVGSGFASAQETATCKPTSRCTPGFTLVINPQGNEACRSNDQPAHPLEKQCASREALAMTHTNQPAVCMHGCGTGFNPVLDARGSPQCKSVAEKRVLPGETPCLGYQY